MQSMMSVSWAQSDDESHFIQILNQMQMLSDKSRDAYSKGNYIEAANYSGKTLSILKESLVISPNFMSIVLLFMQVMLFWQVIKKLPYV